MQKLTGKPKDAPTGTSLTRGSASSVLNKPETVSARDIVRPVNIPEENQPQHREDRNKNVSCNVYVLNMRGQPLMPTTPRKARKLLEEKRANVVKRTPFTIQMKYATGETKQPVTLGIDTGYENVGFSASTDKKELISGTVKLRTDIPKLLTERKMYRRGRRNKLWYREPRFDNRKRKTSWLSPSIEHKLLSHIRIMGAIAGILPVTEIVIESANFDIQKIKNPEISGIDYQHGEQFGFWNTREYVLFRDNHECQQCFGKSGDKILSVHHVHGKAEGATDRPEELLTVCTKCHADHHAGKITIPDKEIHRFKAETFMSTIWKRMIIPLQNKFGDAIKTTYGYITKSNRIALELPKSHVNDAFVIAGGTNQPRCNEFHVEQHRRNNRGIQQNRKGHAPSIRRTRYKIQPHDIVKFENENYSSMGCFNKGTWIRIKDDDETKNASMKKIELIKHGQGLSWT